MVKVFNLNQNGKIELTKDELENLLNQAYWEGYRNQNIWTYTSPNVWSSSIHYDASPYTIKTSVTTADYNIKDNL